MLTAITRSPPSSLVNCEITYLDRQPIGYSVEAIDSSEFAKAEAGLTCLSLVF